MATNIPPHNLGEVVDALVALIDDPTIDVDRLTKHVKGPTSRPAGSSSAARDPRGVPLGPRPDRHARARHIEELRGGKTAIIVSELPYGVKKGGDAGVIKKIADLVNDKVIRRSPTSRTSPTRPGCGSRSSSSARRSRRSS
jgi:DNA gyrase subunit A